MSSWVLSYYQPILKDKFYLKFVLFGIRAKHHVTGSSHGRATYDLD